MKRPCQHADREREMSSKVEPGRVSERKSTGNRRSKTKFEPENINTITSEQISAPVPTQSQKDKPPITKINRLIRKQTSSRVDERGG